jgi:hypothetical protein
MTAGSSSGTQSSEGGIEEGESPPHGSTLEKRNPKWLQDTLKEAPRLRGSTPPSNLFLNRAPKGSVQGARS